MSDPTSLPTPDETTPTTPTAPGADAAAQRPTPSWSAPTSAASTPTTPVEATPAAPSPAAAPAPAAQVPAVTAPSAQDAATTSRIPAAPAVAQTPTTPTASEGAAADRASWPAPSEADRYQGVPTAPAAGDEGSARIGETPWAATAPAAGSSATDAPTSSPAAADTTLLPNPFLTGASTAHSSATTATRSARRGPGWLALGAAMVATAAISVGSTLALTGVVPSGATRTTAAAATSASTTVAPVSSTGEAADWQAVAAAVSPAVVTISVTTQSSSAVGSGVIYDASGHIVTNYHVISSALDGQGSLTVTLADGRLYEATVVGHDQSTDLAVIALTDPPSDLTVATFGSSSDLTVGQEVMAIGSPLGLSNTATTGIISALDRPVEVSTSESQEQTDPNDPFGQLPQFGQNQQQTASESVITNAIQVDASINPGNSGGPLFDDSGAVIGINSSIASMSSSSSSEAGSIGLGFAIPVDLVKSVADQLIASGTVDHAVLGVQITTATTEVDGTTRAGAEIAAVTDGGAADEAGLRKGDVVIAVDGHAVDSSKSLSGYIRRYTGGSQVTISYVRDGKAYDVTVTLRSKES